MRLERTLQLIGSLSILVLSLWCTMIFHVPAASAHSLQSLHTFVIGSDPVDGSTISNPPGMIRIFFDADLSSASTAHVYAFTPDQHEVDIGQSNIPANNARELDIPLISKDQLLQGSYEVQWTALANDDGHTTHGLIGFNIGHSSTGLSGIAVLGPSTSNCLPQLLSSENNTCSQTINFIGILSVAWDWLVVMALTLWIGILVVEGLLVEQTERNNTLLLRIRQHSRPLQLLSLTALLFGEVVSLILRVAHFTQTANAGSIDLGALQQVLFAASYGYLWLARIGLLLCALGLLRWNNGTSGKAASTLPDSTLFSKATGSSFSQMRQRVLQEQTPQEQPLKRNTQEQTQVKDKEQQEVVAETTSRLPLSRRYIGINLGIAALIVLTFALMSDTVQLAQLHLSAIVLTWLYIVSRSIWLGSAAYLGYVLLPLLPKVEPDRHAEMLVTVLRRFIPLLLASISIFLISQLYQSEVHIRDLQQFLTAPYGRTLLVSYAVIAVLLGFSFYMLLILRPRLTRQTVLLHVVGADLPAKRTRQSSLGQTEHSIRQGFGIAAWLAAALLLCAALMAFFAPPILFPAINYGSGATNQTAPATQPQTQQVGNLSVSLQVVPARANENNIVTIMLRDSTGKPVTDAQVQLSTNMKLMHMETAHATISGGNPVYSTTFAKGSLAFTMGGLWTITVQIQRPHQAAVTTTFEVMLEQ
ncbi:MAG: copper resistance protein CopC [Chloroflexota bacterium]|nr:copper resistance protein CopC [Chloroflexota bacterium]